MYRSYKLDIKELGYIKTLASKNFINRTNQQNFSELAELTEKSNDISRFPDHLPQNINILI